MTKANGTKQQIVTRNPLEMATKTIRPTEADGFLWPDGWTVTVQEISYVDHQKLLLAGMSGNKAIPQSKRELEATQITVLDLDNRKAALAKMMAGIQSWTFTNGKNQVVPVTELALEKLDNLSGEFIIAAIDELNPSRDDEFQSDSGNELQNGEG